MTSFRFIGHQVVNYTAVFCGGFKSCFIFTPKFGNDDPILTTPWNFTWYLKIVIWKEIWNSFFQNLSNASFPVLSAICFTITMHYHFFFQQSLHHAVASFSEKSSSQRIGHLRSPSTFNLLPGGQSFGHGNCGPWPEGAGVGISVTWWCRYGWHGDTYGMVIFSGLAPGDGGDICIYIYIFFFSFG